MTLQTYDSEKLEKLVLRFFDLTAQLRTMSSDARKFDLREIPINDRKALQWCESLELWVQKTRLSFDIALTEHQRRGKE